MQRIVVFFLLLVTQLALSQTQTGKASFYADAFEGRQTASGEIYKHDLSTAAHRKLPFGTKVRVTNLQSGKSAIVKINDRGPFIRGRIIDLSQSVANYLGILESGVSEVKIEVLADQNTAIRSYKGSSNSSVSTPTPPIQNQPLPSKAETTPENFETESPSDDFKSEFFELNVNEVEPDFYGVQIASFEQSDNLLRMVNRLKIDYNENAIIQVKPLDDTKVYTVILGQFKTREAADSFKKTIQDQYPGAFVVDMTSNN